MKHESHIEFLVREIDTFVATVRDADLDVAVPSCPGWDLAALIRHQGRVHRWAGWHVRELAQERHTDQAVGIEYPPDVELPAWLADGGAALVEVLRAVDPTAPMWAWGPDQHARFWSRRQLHETAVHRVDAELALGRTSRVDPPVAVDAIDELLDNLPAATYFSPDVAKLVGNGESIHLHCTDTDLDDAADGEWMITLHPDRFTYDHAHGKGDVAVRGQASDLLLMVYGRIPLDERFEVFGDRALLDFWLAHSKL